LWFVVADPIRPRQPACVAGRPSNRLVAPFAPFAPFVKSVASVILRCLYTEVKIGLKVYATGLRYERRERLGW